jgi:hypothetical protein
MHWVTNTAIAAAVIAEQRHIAWCPRHSQFIHHGSLKGLELITPCKCALTSGADCTLLPTLPVAGCICPAHWLSQRCVQSEAREYIYEHYASCPTQTHGQRWPVARLTNVSAEADRLAGHVNHYYQALHCTADQRVKVYAFQAYASLWHRVDRPV